MMDDRPRRDRTSFLAELAAIAQDPRGARASSEAREYPHLAEDALQDTFYAVARTRDPQSIHNLHAFFCKTLIRQINHQLAHPTLILVEDISAISDRYQDRPLSSADVLSADFETELHTLLQVEEWLTRLRNERNKLAASVPRCL